MHDVSEKQTASGYSGCCFSMHGNHRYQRHPRSDAASHDRNFQGDLLPQLPFGRVHRQGNGGGVCQRPSGYQQQVYREPSANSILLQQNSEAITRYLDQHRRFLQIINSPHGDPQFDYKHSRVLMEQLISAAAPQSSLHPYYLRFLIDGTNSVLDSWLSDPTPMPPKKMAVILTDMFRRVLL